MHQNATVRRNNITTSIACETQHFNLIRRVRDSTIKSNERTRTAVDYNIFAIIRIVSTKWLPTHQLHSRENVLSYCNAVWQRAITFWIPNNPQFEMFFCFFLWICWLFEFMYLLMMHCTLLIRRDSFLTRFPWKMKKNIQFFGIDTDQITHMNSSLVFTKIK